MNETDEDDLELDPIFASSVREMKWVLLTWVISFAWVIGYCFAYGYPADGEPLSTTFGMPSWAFWGVFVPYLATAAFTSWFAMRKMEDHPLEEAADSEPTDV